MRLGDRDFIFKPFLPVAFKELCKGFGQNLFVTVCCFSKFLCFLIPVKDPYIHICTHTNTNSWRTLSQIPFPWKVFEPLVPGMVVSRFVLPYNLELLVVILLHLYKHNPKKNDMNILVQVIPFRDSCSINSALLITTLTSCF